MPALFRIPWIRCLVVALLGSASIVCATGASPQNASPPVRPSVIPARSIADLPEILRREPTPLADADNAFVAWQQAIDLAVPLPLNLEMVVHDVLTAGLSPDARDSAEIDAWILANDAALQQFDAGLSRLACRVPAVDSVNQSLPYIGPLRSVARLYALRARQRAAAGDHAAASRDLIALLRTGALLRDGGGQMPQYILGLSVGGLAVARIEAWLDRPDLDAASVRRVLDAANRTVPAGTSGAHAWAAEFRVNYLRQVERLVHAYRTEGSDHDLAERRGLPAIDADAPPWRITLRAILDERTEMVDVDDTLRVGAEIYGRICRDQLTPYPERDPALLEHIGAVRENAGRRAADAVEAFGELVDAASAGTLDLQGAGVRDTLARLHNAGGLMFIRMALPAPDRLIATRLRTTHEALRVLLAIRLHVAATGLLPASLDDLSRRGIIDAVPVDPCSMASFGYDPEGGRLYSVWTNGVDDGGQADRNRDRVWRVLPSG